MANPSFGPKIRTVRRKRGLTQKQLAESLGISASYLNLIEHDKRPLSAPLLIKMAGLFGLDLQAFSVDDDARVLAEAMEVLGDPMFEELESAGEALERQLEDDLEGPPAPEDTQPKPETETHTRSLDPKKPKHPKRRPQTAELRQPKP